jgi:hypothetical protein
VCVCVCVCVYVCVCVCVYVYMYLYITLHALGISRLVLCSYCTSILLVLGDFLVLGELYTGPRRIKKRSVISPEWCSRMNYQSTVAKQ